VNRRSGVVAQPHRRRAHRRGTHCRCRAWTAGYPRLRQ
jgi:hypothetical protein